MTEQFLILAAPVFVAAALQSATGLGFGMIAGPFLLLTLNGIGAVQATILLSLAIALVAWPPVIADTDRRALAGLGAGSLLGLPLGGALALLAGMTALKAGAALIVAASATLILRGAASSEDGASRPDECAERGRNAASRMIGAGAVSGAMSAALGMPGPAPAGLLAERGASKEALRATVLSLFVGSFSGALILHSLAIGIGAPAIQLAGLLAAPAIGGAVAGHFLVRRFSAQLFRRILTALLVAAATSLAINVIFDLL
ncbi:MAG: hypothetical protein Tsb0010_02620 [Parvularculaceae bacterium]